MNERIKQLAEQANELDYETFDEYNHKTVQHYKFNKEKFAELIVRECGVALSPMLRDMVSRGQAFDLIKDHFGVEE
jgi:hypothetical protein